MKKYFLVLIIICCFNLATSSAQSLGIAGLAAFPLGEFEDDDDRNSNGFATLGPGVTIDFAVPIYKQYIHWASSGSYFANFFSDEKAENDGILRNVTDLTGGTYHSIPIVTGVRVSLPLDEIVLYGQLQLGINILNESELEGKVSGYPVEVEFDQSTSFANVFTAGLIVNSKLNFGVRYFKSGEHEIDYESWINGERSFDIESVQLFVGINYEM